MQDLQEPKEPKVVEVQWELRDLKVLKEPKVGKEPKG